MDMELEELYESAGRLKAKGAVPDLSLIHI